MWRRNESAVISSSSASPRRCQTADSTVRGEDLVLRLGRRERAEVVLAERAARPTRRAAPRRAGADTTRSAAPRTASARRGGRCGSGSCAPAPSSARGSPAAPPRRRSRRRRPAARRSAPAAARSGGAPPSTSTEATWPSACTPVSVRPATASSDQAWEDVARAPPAARPRPSAARLRGPAAEAGAVVLER